MADRFWVGGTGNINDTARWAATSGGAGGQSVPTAADNAFFDGLSDRLTTQSVTSITRVSTTATVTCNNHGYSAGNTVTISGASQTEYNGTFTISNVATNTFDYTVTGTPATPATGTITVARRAAFTVTINATFNCLSFIVGDGIAATVLAQPMTIAGSSPFTVAGSLFYPATNLTRSNSSPLTFSSTTTGNTITTNGAIGNVQITLDGVGGGWTLGSAYSSTNNFNINNGSFNTGNYNITATGLTSPGSGTRTIILGSSTINVNFGVNLSPTNLTFNAGTSTINVTSTGNPFTGNGLTYYNVGYTSTAATVSHWMTGANTFNNFTIDARSATGIGEIQFYANQTINGTLSLQTATTDPTRALRVVSNVIGTARTLTCNAVSIGDGVNFQDITIAGAAAPFNASTKLTGDLGGNTGITFPAPKTVYWNLAGGQVWQATAWATTATGTPAVANFPLAQDIAFITEAGAAGAIQVGLPWSLPSISFDNGISPRTSVVTFATTDNTTIYGDLKLSSGVVYSANATMTFAGRKTQNLTCANKTIPGNISVTAPGTSLVLQDDLNLVGSVTLNTGTLDISNKILSATTFISSSVDTRLIAFGTTGKIQLTGNNTGVFSMYSADNFTFTGTSNIELVYTGSTGSRTIISGANTGVTSNNALSFTVVNGFDTIVTFFNATYTSLRNFIFADTFAGTWGGTGSNTGRPSQIYGDLRLSPNMTVAIDTGNLSFLSPSIIQQFTTSGKSFPRPVIKDGAGTLRLMDNLTLAAGQAFTHTQGTVDLNNKILTVSSYSTSNSNVRSLLFGTGELVLTGTGTVWDAATGVNLTLSSGTGIIRITDTSATGKTFAGGGVQTYPNLRIEGGTSTSTITLTGANRFATITNARTVGYTIVFPNATTILNTWGLNGTDGNLVTLSRTGGSGQFTIQSGSSGLLIAQFMSISNSIFLPSGNGYAVKSTNGGGNNGWVFGAPTFGKFLVFFNP